MKEEILKALKWRYATKVFDPKKKVSKEDIHTILESARLSPSSIGLEMWKFIVINNPEIRAKLREAGYGQSKITDASHIVLITYRTDIAENIGKERLERTAKIQNQDVKELDGLKQMIDNSIEQKTKDGTLEFWAKMQGYIPLGIMIETASLLGIDSCPMEGFSNEKVDEILNLKEKNLKSATMLAIGYRGNDPQASLPKVRRAFDEVVEFI
jgi:nitroreductase / dihydropteridine reductase